MNKHLLSFTSQVLLAFLLVIALSAGTQAADDRPPNVVLLFADDLGYGDLGCCGHPYARTPAIDQLAKEGTRFTQFYVTGVTCNPSRTGLMTGLFPARFPKYAADFGFGDRSTITELLKKRGYRTGHFGKWHIGPDDSDGTYGIDTVKTIGKSRDRSAGRDTDLYSAAIEFIRENKDEPFYVNVWGHATHFPVNTPAELAGRFKDVTVDREDFSPTMQHKFDECLRIGGDLDESMRQYLGDVYQIDLNVGRVLKALDDLGLRENTIVVFSSDHGPAPVILGKKGAREFSNNMLGYAGKFRGGKHEQYEGGTRVPFIIRWPDKVEAGRVDTTNVCSFVDWLPTFARLPGLRNCRRNLTERTFPTSGLVPIANARSRYSGNPVPLAAHLRCDSANGSCTCLGINVRCRNSMIFPSIRVKVTTSQKLIRKSSVALGSHSKPGLPNCLRTMRRQRKDEPIRSRVALRQLPARYSGL